MAIVYALNVNVALGGVQMPGGKMYRKLNGAIRTRVRKAKEALESLEVANNLLRVKLDEYNIPGKDLLNVDPLTKNFAVEVRALVVELESQLLDEVDRQIYYRGK